MLRRLVYQTRIPGLLLMVVLGILWELSVRLGWVEAMTWPALSEVLVTWFRFLISGEVIPVFLPSLYRLAAGYALAAVVGVSLGLAIGYFRPLFNLFEPLVESLRPIPIPAYIPVVILFLGIDHTMKIFMVALACFFPVLLNTYSGVRAVDPVEIQTGLAFGLGTRQILLQIILPSSAPYIFTGLRISMAISLIVSVVAEMVASTDGIGYYILNAQRTFLIQEMYAGIICLGILGYLLNRLFVWVEHKALHWRHLGLTE